jgi:ion channel-forming bestrophin family protein
VDALQFLIFAPIKAQMVEYNPKNWFTLIFQIHKSEMMRYLLPNIFMMGAYSGILCYLFLTYGMRAMPQVLGFHSLLGVVLGLVLVFRTNTAYDRWWEGRKLWGSIVNHSRSLAMKINATFPKEEKLLRTYFSQSIPNFAFSFKEHLRGLGRVKLEELELDGMDYAKYAESEGHFPNRILTSMHQVVSKLFQEKKITGDEYKMLIRELDGLVDAMGACERIKKTPIPYSYSMYVKKVIFGYLVSLPLSFIYLFEYWTIPAVMFTTYVLAGIEIIAEEIEDPFGTDSNDLDTDGISRTISRNAKEILLEK